jgi:putative ABC transport system permease protein
MEVLVVLKSVIQDIRFGVRMLCKRPLFTTVAVLTLGFGIGAATAMFSVVDAVLIKALPYRDAGTLVTVWQVVPRWRDVVNLTDYWDKGWLSYAQYRTWREAGNLSLEIAIHDDSGMTLTGVGEPERLAVGEASASLLRVLGVRPAHPESRSANGRRSRLRLRQPRWDPCVAAR